MNNSPLLIVEDNVLFADRLRDSFLSKKISPVVCGSLEYAYDILNQQKFEVAILDRVLSDGDSLDLLPYLHASHYHTRVLLMSRKSHAKERILGLESGANDYLPKPFSFAELYLRTLNLLYAKKTSSEKFLICGPLRLSTKSGELKIGNKVIRLRKRESQILSSLLRHRGHLITRERVMQDVWSDPDFWPTNTTLDVYIRRIRMKIAPFGDIIQTVRGFGYQVREYSPATSS